MKKAEIILNSIIISGSIFMFTAVVYCSLVYGISSGAIFEL